MAVFLGMPGSEDLAGELARRTNGILAGLELRKFPDGESYVRLPAGIARQALFLVCRLTPPDSLFLPLFFAARTARSIGASSVWLIVPYLPYMRQDQAFREGEAVSSAIFADLVSREFDGLITVDPHLHRYSSLADIYTIPTIAVSAAELIGQWVRDHVENPVIIGPDVESGQWAKAIAEAAGAPWSTFTKVREGDRAVRLESPDLKPWRQRRPVLVDDIISSGATMLEACRQLSDKGFAAPACAVVHGLMDARAGERLERCISAIVTTDTVRNPYNRLAIAPLIAAALDGKDDRLPATSRGDKGNS